MATASELRQQLAQLEREERERDRAGREKQSAAWEAMYTTPGSWEWQVIPDKRRLFTEDVVVEGAQVTKRIKKQLLDEWKLGGPAKFSSDFEQENRWFGMFYYRTEEGILTHEGGGHMVLREPRLCSDAEWAEILAGRIPAKFLR